jgi:hypothetical protein
MDARKRLHAGAGRDRLIGFGDGALAKQRMVGVARGGLDGEQRQARGFAVDAVDRRQVLDAQTALQAHQQGLLHIASGGRDRQEVRFVSHHQPVVLKQDGFIERDHSLVRDVAVVVQKLSGANGRIDRNRLSGVIEHVAGGQALRPGFPGDAWQALGQEIQQSDPRAWGYGDTAGADAVAGRNQRTTLPSGRIVTRSMARVESRVPARRLMRKPPTS